MRINLEQVKKVLLVLLGSVITAIGLQFFLLPNHLLDGGVTGISILAAHLSGLPLGLFLLLLNIPFVILGYKKFGKGFAALSVLGIVTLALLNITHVEHGFTDIPILGAVFGGAIVGLGVGIVIRYGGIIDGADTVAVLIDRVTIFTVSEAIMVINGIIITSAGFIFGWENAMYSLIAYFVAHKAIDITVEGLDESRCVWVVSMHIHEVGNVINETIQEPVTYVRESDAANKAEPHGMLLAVITRFEEQRVKKAIRRTDPKAFIVVTGAHEVLGKIPENSLQLPVGLGRS